jgi:hypothetical protein
MARAKVAQARGNRGGSGAMMQLPEGISIGHWTDADGRTGCTVVLAPAGAMGSVDVRGAAPATLGTDALAPATLVERAHGVLLTGGSAFGLAAAGGVLRHLEEQGAGYALGSATVPIVGSGELNKDQANRVAAVAHDGIARAIGPAHTQLSQLLRQPDEVLGRLPGQDPPTLASLIEAPAAARASWQGSTTQTSPTSTRSATPANSANTGACVASSPRSKRHDCSR